MRLLIFMVCLASSLANPFDLNPTKQDLEKPVWPFLSGLDPIQNEEKVNRNNHLFGDFFNRQRNGEEANPWGQEDNYEDGNQGSDYQRFQNPFLSRFRNPIFSNLLENFPGISNFNFDNLKAPFKNLGFGEKSVKQEVPNPGFESTQTSLKVDSSTEPEKPSLKQMILNKNPILGNLLLQKYPGLANINLDKFMLNPAEEFKKISKQSSQETEAKKESNESNESNEPNPLMTLKKTLFDSILNKLNGVFESKPDQEFVTTKSLAPIKVIISEKSSEDIKAENFDEQQNPSSSAPIPSISATPESTNSLMNKIVQRLTSLFKSKPKESEPTETVTPAPASSEPNSLVRFFYFIIHRSKNEKVTTNTVTKITETKPEVVKAEKVKSPNSGSGVTLNVTCLGFSLVLVLFSWKRYL